MCNSLINSQECLTGVDRLRYDSDVANSRRLSKGDRGLVSLGETRLRESPSESIALIYYPVIDRLSGSTARPS